MREIRLTKIGPVDMMREMYEANFSIATHTLVSRAYTLCDVIAIGIYPQLHDQLRSAVCQDRTKTVVQALSITCVRRRPQTQI